MKKRNFNRNIYLNMKSLQEAREILFNRFKLSGLLKEERIDSVDSVGRVLAQPVYARASSPNFHAAAMDGIAVKADATFGARETNPEKLIVGRDAYYINTGHVMPEDTDSVIMIENVNALNEEIVEIEAPAYPWQNVRKMGEDIVATELLFPRNHLITPYCVGALLTGGVFEVSVKEKPKVLIIPTGKELVDWQEKGMEDDNFFSLEPGMVIESNSCLMGKLAESCGAVYERSDIITDDSEKIKEAVTKGVDGDYHSILILSGSSAGSEDFAKQVILDSGETLVHGVTIMPGKPVIIGEVKGKPVFGIPGYPVSAIVVFEQFVSPLIAGMLGQLEKQKEKIVALATRKIPSKLGIEEFLRVKLGVVGKKMVAMPLPRGAGSITSITEADGIIRIPENSEGINYNEPVEAELLCPLSSIENTIVVTGSHDNTLDVLADHIKKKGGSLRLSSSHVGSLGGLMAIKKGVCHLAGSHLLDTKDGTYNISYIKKYLPDISVKLVNLVIRDQGLIVPRGNPKDIKGIEDLAKSDIRFINRQAGSGTRILLDFKLKNFGINPDSIAGYGNEEFTHMSVAVAVLSGAVDTGLGIYAAAKALNLDFVPVVTEQYDLVIPEKYFESKNIKSLLEIINSKKFKKKVLTLGGYGTEKTGNIITIKSGIK